MADEDLKKQLVKAEKALAKAEAEKAEALAKADAALAGASAKKSGAIFFEGDSPNGGFYKITAIKDLTARICGRLYDFKKGEPVVMSASCYRPLSKMLAILRIERVTK